MRLPIMLVLTLMLPLAAAGSARGAQVATPAGSALGSTPGDLTGRTPQPLTGERRAAFEAYVAGALHRFGVPGASVAVVQGGEVVYLNGFGVTVMGSTQPVTSDTMFMIGSITKSMTTMLAATLVDDGTLRWDTPLVALLPAFAVDDPALTQSLSVRDAFCNCSGLPGLNLEASFASGALTLDEVVTALADVTPLAPYGQAFIYNNLLVSTGGYALGVAHSGGAGDVGQAYDLALREWVLGPIGMTRTTFDPLAALATDDYALPHAVDLSGVLQQVPLMVERGRLPRRPAGALWSNAREMARYLQAELARGVAPGGTRVVSAENLVATWEPAVSAPNLYGGPPEMAATMSGYGLGWMSGEYRGLRLVSHTGGTAGFTSQIAFLPEADLGIVMLSNALSIRPIPLAFQFAIQIRLYELLFDQPAELDAQLAAWAEAFAEERPPLALGEVDPKAVAPYLGRYANAALGEVTLSMRGDRLVLDTGALSSALRPLADGGDEPVYVLHDPPLSLFSEAYGATVSLTGGEAAPSLTIEVPASVTDPEQEYVFTPLAAATPTPDQARDPVSSAIRRVIRPSDDPCHIVLARPPPFPRSQHTLTGGGLQA